MVMNRFLLVAAVLIATFLAGKDEKTKTNKPKKEKTIDIKSETLSYESDVAVFRKNVVVVYEGGTMTADLMRCYFHEKTGKVYKIHAEGNVTFTKDKQTAHSGAAFYLLNKKTVIMTQKPILIDGKNKMHAKKIIMKTDSQVTKLEQPKGIFYSDDLKDKKKKDDKDKKKDESANK